MNQYFDFHYHPLFKQCLSIFEDNYPSNRTQEALASKVTPNNDIVAGIDRRKLHILGSQCSLSQMQAAGESIGVAAIVSLEYAIANGASGGAAGLLLRANLVSPLDKRYFDSVAEGTISYYRLFIKELNLYSIMANIGPSRRADRTAKINILARSKNQTVDFESLTGTTLALSMEGGHNLNRNLIGLAPDHLDTIPNPGKKDALYDDFVANCNQVLTPADSLRHLFSAMWQEEMDLMYVTLTHLTYIAELPLATHAYGMKFIHQPNFYPQGSGITDAGKDVIRAAYGMEVNGRRTPVLIDVKHMSLKSRLDLYEFWEANNFVHPILATHMGVTGCSIGEWLNVNSEDNDGLTTVEAPLEEGQIIAMENSGGPDPIKYYFNPWTINLFDEDIVAILKSNGMIGLSLDKRIIGALASDQNTNYHTTEYLSTTEFNFLKAKFPVVPYKEMPDTDPDTDLDVDPDRELNDFERDRRREVANFGLTILHIVAVGLNNGFIDVWSHIVMGSDYDGLIEPMDAADYCTDINDNEIEDILFAIMLGLESSYLHFYPSVKVRLLPTTPSGHVDMVSLKAKLRGVMHDNGRAFLKKWYNDLLPR